MLKLRLIATTVAVIGVAAVTGGVVASRHSTSPVIRSYSDNVEIQPSGYDALSADQKLDRALSLPGMRGVVEGRAGVPVVHTVYLPDKGLEELAAHNPRLADQVRALEHPSVVDVSFQITAVYGTSTPPYAVGSTITLRLPTDTTPNIDVKNIPTVAAGETVLIFVRDQGIVMGGNTPLILVASRPPDVIHVRDGIASGEGFQEPLDQLVQHFQSHPVPSGH